MASSENDASSASSRIVFSIVFLEFS
jgi:hypothetical protein